MLIGSVERVGLVGMLVGYVLYQRQGVLPVVLAGV